MEHHRASARTHVIVIAAIVVVGVIVWFVADRRPSPAGDEVKPSTQPTTAPATHPTTSAAAKPKLPQSFMDVVLASHPAFPTTQPLGVPLDLREAARLVIDDPIYLDAIGQLWITRADAEAVAGVLKRADREQAHVVPERVVFVHRAPDAKGKWHAQLVCLRDDGGYELVSEAGRQDMGKAHVYDWPRAFSWVTPDVNAVVVPTRGGISIFRPDRRPMELHHDFYAPGNVPENASPTQALLDWKGLLAWMPWEKGQTGSIGAARVLDDKWIKLDESAGWPNKLLHVIPLLDGGAIQIWNEDHEEYVYLSLAVLDPAQVDEKEILPIVEQLSNADPEKRDEAFSRLTRYGHGIWPLLERIKDEQAPEAQVRIEQLLAAKTEPTLGGMKLMPGRVKIVTRAKGGAALLHSGGGVAVLREDEQPEVIAPAMLAIMPAKSVMLAPQDLFMDLALDKTAIDIVSGEIVVTDEAHGPRVWVSNHFSGPLLKKKERDFKHVVGVDARGRWLFRKRAGDASPTLVIDPTLPDPTPRLPVWRFNVEGGDVGWTKDNWPAIRRGGAWVITASEWRPLDQGKEEMLLELDAAPPTEPTTSPSTSPTTSPAGAPILIDKDGTRYYDGVESLRVVTPDGRTATWPLPDEARGQEGATVWLVCAGDERLFLFNAPGRVLRIKRTPDKSEPFALEATFTRRIPSSDNYQRVWVDPAGRIVIAHDIDTLSILFPSGVIPPEVARKIPASELAEAEEEE